MDTNVDRQGRRTWVAVGLLLILLIFGWVWLGVWNFSTFRDSEEAARYGESFGYVNSLFSGLALIGVIVAIVLQRQELGLQRQELELTRGELRKGAEAQQQLVELSAMAALLQTYLSEYQTSPQQHENAFHALLERAPAKATGHIVYKIRVCRAILEGTYGKAKGTTIGTPEDTSIEAMRIRHWLERLWDGLRLLQNRWGNVESRAALGDTEKEASQAHSGFRLFLDRLRDVRRWADALPPGTDWMGELNKLEQSFKKFMGVLSRATSLQPHIAEGQALIAAVTDLAARVEKCAAAPTRPTAAG